MKRTQDYILQHIVNTDYLLPFGQAIADHKRGMALNETGVFIWELLEHEMSREVIRHEYLERFLTDPEDRDTLTEDLDQFLDLLISFGPIIDDNPSKPQTHEQCAYLGIGGLTLSMSCPPELIDHSFLNHFRIDHTDRIDQHVGVTYIPPTSRRRGTVLLRDYELEVCEREDDFLLLFPTFSQIREVSVSKDGADVLFYCMPPVNDELEFQFFHALRLAFLYLAGKHGMYAIHSASILYRDRAWLFSASAGTGKSTHVNLWRELYQTPALNGDLNLLAIRDGVPVIHGIPWCGTSEIFDKRTLPLGGIILLKRGEDDSVEELPDDKKALLTLQRFISPMWKDVMLKECAQFAERITGKISVCRLRCTKNFSAAATIRDWIDKELQNLFD